jgi:glucose-specific phosphotransferase enzyme IIA component
LTAPTEGAYIELSEVPDETFSSGLMGKGWGFKPSKGEVIAPISGTISSIVLSKHAIGITSENGLELIVHIGMDTLSLNGEGFKIRVKEGDKVNRGELLMKFDLKLLKSKNIEATSVMVITNSEQFKIIEKSTHNTFKAGDDIGKFDIIE